METTVKAATALIEEEVLNRSVLSFWLAVVNAVGTLLLLATWFFAIRSARSWAAERREASAALLQAQDELVRREKLALLGQVADRVGHELRNPLGVMNNAVYFLQAVLSDADETTREYLGIIKDEIVDAERIVSDLLDAVRTKAPNPETVAVGELIQHVLRKCDVPPSVTVHLDIPETLPAIRVDPVQMRQVFWNLITNGMESMPDGGELKISADEDQAANTVTVRIMDIGSGISQEHQASLFLPLFTTKARRVGLGLVVVKNLTQANGGSVGVESIPGKGSEFSVTLPSAN
ncbi:MAG: ATP-binding protein [Sulfuricella sp.]